MQRLSVFTVSLLLLSHVSIGSANAQEKPPVTELTFEIYYLQGLDLLRAFTRDDEASKKIQERLRKNFNEGKDGFTVTAVGFDTANRPVDDETVSRVFRLQFKEKEKSVFLLGEKVSAIVVPLKSVKSVKFNISITAEGFDEVTLLGLHAQTMSIGVVMPLSRATADNFVLVECDRSRCCLFARNRLLRCR